MKRFLNILLLFSTTFVYGVEVNPVSPVQLETLDLVKQINFDQLEGVFYQDEVQNFVLDFDQPKNNS